MSEVFNEGRKSDTYLKDIVIRWLWRLCVVNVPAHPVTVPMERKKGRMVWSSHSAIDPQLWENIYLNDNLPLIYVSSPLGAPEEHHDALMTIEPIFEWSKVGPGIYKQRVDIPGEEGPREYTYELGKEFSTEKTKGLKFKVS